MGTAFKKSPAKVFFTSRQTIAVSCAGRFEPANSGTASLVGSSGRVSYTLGGLELPVKENAGTNGDGVKENSLSGGTVEGPNAST